MIHVSIDSNIAADNLIRILLETRKVACINKVKDGVSSSYRWDGKVVVDDPEILLIMKTKNECVKQVIDLVHQHHPYDVPECIVTPVTAGNKQYVDYVKEETTTANIVPRSIR